MPKTMQVVYKRVEDIKVSPFNPSARVTDLALHVLEEEIKLDGEILQPLTISEDGFLSDGHRRLAIAKKLGIVEVPTITKKGYSNTELWRKMNTGTRRMGSADVFQAIVLHNAPIEALPNYFRYPIETLIDLVGIDLAKEIAEKGYTPHIVRTIQQVMKYCKREEDPTFAQFVTRWLIEQRQNYAVRKAMESKVPLEDILIAINENKKLVKAWKVSEK